MVCFSYKTWVKWILGTCTPIMTWYNMVQLFHTWVFWECAIISCGFSLFGRPRASKIRSQHSAAKGFDHPMSTVLTVGWKAPKGMIILTPSIVTMAGGLTIDGDFRAQKLRTLKHNTRLPKYQQRCSLPPALRPPCNIGKCSRSYCLGPWLF